jgi:protocatechuate 3,4-dioxygenase beta subunit
MNNQRKVFSRREMLEISLGIGGLTALGNSAFAQEAKRLITPEAIVGPFYPVLKPLDKDADLTLIAGNKTRAAGKIVHVTGRVLNPKGEPVKGAKIEIWQANTYGRYSHPSDPYDAPIDPNFQGYTILTTDSEGRYRFKTTKPGAYPATKTWTRPPHIHVDEYIESSLGKMKINNDQIRKLTKLRDELLPKLMSGDEVRVNI